MKHCTWSNTPPSHSAACTKVRYTGTICLLGTLSFNGNKITTTAKQPHPYEYVHDEICYNYRLPNLYAALGCAQLKQLEDFVANKCELVAKYAADFSGSYLHFVTESQACHFNYWLNVASSVITC